MSRTDKSKAKALANSPRAMVVENPSRSTSAAIKTELSPFNRDFVEKLPETVVHFQTTRRYDQHPNDQMASEIYNLRLRLDRKEKAQRDYQLYLKRARTYRHIQKNRRTTNIWMTVIVVAALVIAAVAGLLWIQQSPGFKAAVFSSKRYHEVSYAQERRPLDGQRSAALAAALSKGRPAKSPAAPLKSKPLR